MLHSVWQDIRHSARNLRKSPGFALAAVLTLALGVGANAAMFTVIDAVLLRSLPFPEPEELFVLSVIDPDSGDEDPFSMPNFIDTAGRVESLDGMAAFPAMRFSGVVLTGDGEPEELETAYVSGQFFPTLDVPMLVGRGFGPEEDEPGTNRVVVLSEGLWRQRYNADRGVVGRDLVFDGEPFTVVGVAPASLELPSADADVWAPLSLIDTESIPHQNRWLSWLIAIGRLRDGVTIEAARDELSAITAALEQEYPEDNEGNRAAVARPLKGALVDDERPVLLMLFGAVSLVLLIACANVANLLLARATSRQHESAIRSALGATRGRIVRLALTDSLLLSIAGGAAGLALAAVGIDTFTALSAGVLPRTAEIGLDLRVLAFVTAVSVVTGLTAGVIPAFRTAGSHLNDTLQQAGRRGAGARWRGVLRRGLVVSEVALAVVLVIGSGLLLKSLDRLTSVDPGFDAENLLAVSLNFPDYLYERDGADFHRDYDQILETVRSVPGVISAGAVHAMPGAGFDEGDGFTIPGVELPDGQNRFGTLIRIASPGYFETMQIPLLAGRDLADIDRPEGPRVIVINRVAAERYWPGASPIGTSVNIWAGTAEIVGVVGNVRHGGFDTDPDPTFYVSNAQLSRRRLVLMARTAGDPSRFAGAVVGAIREVVPQQPIQRVAPMTEILSETVGAPRFTTILLGSFAVLALTLAAIGIYGVISYAVSQRTHEMGVRVALGAGRADILRLVLAQGLATALLGAGMGAAAAVALNRFLETMLYEVSGTDPYVYLAVAAGALVVAALACAIPAHRATRVDPVRALQSE